MLMGHFGRPSNTIFFGQRPPWAIARPIHIYIFIYIYFSLPEFIKLNHKQEREQLNHLDQGLA